ncbi:MAG: HIT family protein [Patescibacteria group bacterium]
MTDCLFCKIVAGEIPVHKIYEDSRVMAFLDIAPVNPGHILLLPKEHFENLSDLPDDLVATMMVETKKIAKAMISALGLSAFNININNGSEAGQAIGHSHFHIIPRRAGDGRELWKGREYAIGEAEEIAEKIKAKLV